MKLLRALPYVTCTVGAMLLVVAGATLAQQERARTTESFFDSPTEGITLVVYLENHQPLHRSTAPTFRIELRNSVHHDLLVTLGTMSSNGAHQYPTAISLVLVDPQGKPHWLVLKDFDADRQRASKPFVVPLPAGATFSFPVQLRNYWAPGSTTFTSALAPGKYSLIAQFTGPARLIDVRSLPEQGPRQIPISQAPFDQVNSYPKGAARSSPLAFDVAP